MAISVWECPFFGPKIPPLAKKNDRTYLICVRNVEISTNHPTEEISINHPTESLYQDSFLFSSRPTLAFEFWPFDEIFDFFASFVKNYNGPKMLLVVHIVQAKI